MLKINTNSIYWNRYVRFIESRAERTILENSLVELHHIIPKCAGGNDEPSNLVGLTYREHFIAHWLLSKVGVDDVWYKLRFAFGCMGVHSASNQSREYLTSKQFETAKMIRKETLKQWNTINGPPCKSKAWYVDEEGNSYRCHPWSPKIKDFNLTPRSPTTGKKWYTDGTNFFMLHSTDPRVVALRLRPGCPIKGKKKQYSLEISKKLSNDRRDRLWFNDGLRSFKLKADDPMIKNKFLSPGRLISSSGLERIKNGASWKRSEDHNRLNSTRQRSKKRYNDGDRNFTLDPNDPLIFELGLKRGVVLSNNGKSSLSQASKARDRSYIIGKKWFNDGSKNYRLLKEIGETLGLSIGKLHRSKSSNP